MESPEPDLLSGTGPVEREDVLPASHVNGSTKIRNRSAEFNLRVFTSMPDEQHVGRGREFIRKAHSRSSDRLSLW